MNNDKLLEAIKKMQESEVEGEQFFDELFKAEFLCPIRADVEYKGKFGKSAIAIQQEHSVEMMSLEDEEGANYLAAFTDIEQMEEWADDETVDAAKVNFEQYLDICMEEDSIFDGVVINPFRENVTLPKEIFERVEEEDDKNVSEVELSIPEEDDEKPTEKIKQVLKEYFETEKDINEAFLLWMEKDEDKGYLLILDIGEEKAGKIFKAVDEICRPFLGETEMYMVPAASEFGEAVASDFEHFYTTEL